MMQVELTVDEIAIIRRLIATASAQGTEMMRKLLALDDKMAALPETEPEPPDA